MPPQTAEQRQKAFEAAGLDKTQQLAVAAGVQVPSTYTPTITAPPAMTTDSLSTPTQPYTTPPSPSVPPEYYKGIIDSIPSATDVLASYTGSGRSARQVTADTARGTISEKMLSTLEETLGRSAAQRAADEAAGVPNIERDLTEVTSQITALKNEAAAIPLQIQNESIGRGRTAAGVAPLETARLRENAIKALSLSSIAATLQGNLALARQEADRAVAAEFDPLEANLKYLQALYEVNKDDITRADSEQAKRIEAALLDRSEKLTTAKQDRTELLKLVNTAVQNGASVALVNEALAKDLAGATTILAPYASKTEEWSEPYLLGGDYVQKNKKTGEVRTAVNVATVNVAAGRGGGSTMTDTTTPENVRNDLIADIEGGASLSDLYTAYPDVSTSYISSLHSSLSKESDAEKEFLTPEYIESLFTDDQLKEAAKEAGFRHWYSTWATEKEKYIQHLFNVVKQYRTSGYTDQKILEMMK